MTAIGDPMLMYGQEITNGCFGLVKCPGAYRTGMTYVTLIMTYNI